MTTSSLTPISLSQCRVKTLVVSILNLCNYQCPQCSYSTPRSKKFMSFETFRLLADQCSLAGIEKVRFLGLSEPTLHPTLGKFIAYTRERCLRTHLITNGAFVLRRDAADMLRRSPPSELEISIDAADAYEYKLVRGKGESYFNRLIPAVVKFLETVKATDHNVDTVVSFVGHPETASSFDRFQAFWKDKVDLVRYRGSHNFSGQSSLGAAKSTTVEGVVACSFVRDRLFVDEAGCIHTCNMDRESSFRLGQVSYEVTLADYAVHSSRLALIEAMLSGAAPDQCRTCSNCAGLP